MCVCVYVCIHEIKVYPRTSILKRCCKLPRYSPIFNLLRPLRVMRNLATELALCSTNRCRTKYCKPRSGSLTATATPILLSWMSLSPSQYITTVNKNNYNNRLIKDHALKKTKTRSLLDTANHPSSRTVLTVNSLLLTALSILH